MKITKKNAALILVANVTALWAVLTFAGVWPQDYAFVSVVRFNTSVSEPGGEAGEVWWNDEEKTLNAALTSNVKLQMGQELLAYVLNDSGVDIADGNAVQVTGSQGGQITVAKTDITTSGIYGIVGLATEDIDDGESGMITVFGRVRGINTTGYSAEGVPVYLDVAPGALTQALPAAPNVRVAVGIVERKDVNGVVFVRPRYFQGVEYSSDVYISSISDGDILVWDAASSRFTNIEMSDVPYFEGGDPSAPAEGTGLIYLQDGTGSRGNAGDIVAVSTESGATRYTIIHDHSAGAAW